MNIQIKKISELNKIFTHSVMDFFLEKDEHFKKYMKGGLNNFKLFYNVLEDYKDYMLKELVLCPKIRVLIFNEDMFKFLEAYKIFKLLQTPRQIKAKLKNRRVK